MEIGLPPPERPMPPSKAYRVKPLSWQKQPQDPKCPDAEIWMAENIFGRFVYGVDNQGLWYFQTPGPSQDRPNADAAREAAQSYYESLVRVHLVEIREEHDQ